MRRASPRALSSHADAAAPHLLSSCINVHRLLASDAARLAERLRSSHRDESDRLRLGASCMTLALREVFAPDERRNIRCWTECIRAERQIRAAVARVLRDRVITTAEYDRVFRLVRDASRLRDVQLLSLRQRLRRSSVT